MTATYDEALDQMHTRFRTEWLADSISDSFPIEYWDDDDGDPETVNADNEPPTYARLIIQHVTDNQATLANENGQRRYRAEGLITVQIRTPAGDGQFLARQLVPIAQRAYRGKTTSGGVLFRNVRVNEVGRNGNHFQTNVLADFEYDEVV